MNSSEPSFFARPCTAFTGFEQIAAGPLAEVALAVKAIGSQPSAPPTLVFDDATGEVVDLDLRGSTAEIVARLAEWARLTTAAARSRIKSEPKPAGQAPGRPRLGVVAREVTLLPRHWEWLAQQPGGASAALRRLVEDARLGDGGKTAQRKATGAAYRFLSCMAGNLPGFEEASRALFAGDWKRFTGLTSEWPQAVREYAGKLAGRA